jgi:putative ABC transport system permease protein
MTWPETIRLAMRMLARNRSRSLLTMLGVIIGVAAVIVTVAIGAGARTSVAAQINGLGSNLIIVIPGNLTQGGVNTGTGAASTLTPDDGLALTKIPGVAAVSPGVVVRAQVVSPTANWSTQIVGVAPSYLAIRNWPIARGTFFDDAATNGVAKVCVLGQTVAENLFPNQDPVGRTVIVRGVPFTVSGLLTRRGQSASGQDQDDTVLIPYTSAMQRLTGQTMLGILFVSARDSADIQPVQNAILRVLEARHRIAPGAPDDFAMRNLQDIASAASGAATTMEVLLAAVATVSLVVGGIGIMNIMLVSVTERTREIGLRLAVGARAGAILRQFLTEAVVLSTSGGAIGAVCGLAGAAAVATFAHWSAAVPPGAVILAVAFSALVGIFFGYYPATKAARLDPIEALRAE